VREGGRRGSEQYAEGKKQKERQKQIVSSESTFILTWLQPGGLDTNLFF
jgi:hypothetical protein